MIGVPTTVPPMNSTAATSTVRTQTGSGRDRFVDFVRAAALLVVVFGHWFATLPRTADGTTVANDHLLHAWPAIAPATILLQVVPLFVFVSAAVTTPPTTPRTALAWWARRAQRLAHPTLVYLAVLAGLTAAAAVRTPVASFTELFSGSLTVHLWFIVMLLIVQAALPLCRLADLNFGLKTVAVLVAAVVAVDVVRVLPHITDVGLSNIGAHIATAAPGVGWVNVLLVWLIPQQLGVAWSNRRLQGHTTGSLLAGSGLGWLAVTTLVGYPVSMVGADPTTGASNVLPPTAALVGVMLLQAGLVLLVEHPVRRWLNRSARSWKVVQLLAAFGMPLYLWHKLAELPAVWTANRLGLLLDRGLPGDPSFWSGRLLWFALCAAASVPLVGVAATIEKSRSTPSLTGVWWRQLTGAVAVAGGCTWALSEGLHVAPVATLMVGAGVLLLLRQNHYRTFTPPASSSSQPESAADATVAS